MTTKREAVREFLREFSLSPYERLKLARRMHQRAEASSSLQARSPGEAVPEPEVRTELVAIPAKAEPVRRKAASEGGDWATRALEEDRQLEHSRRERSRRETAANTVRYEQESRDWIARGIAKSRQPSFSVSFTRTEEGLIRLLPGGKWEVALTPAQLRQLDQDCALAEARRREESRQKEHGR